MGTKLPFCILRGTTFYWRRRLPSPFKMSVEFSLGTKDLRVARGLSSMLTIETDRAYAVLREGKMTPEQVETFARQKFAEHSAKLSAVHQLGLDLEEPVAGRSYCHARGRNCHVHLGAAWTLGAAIRFSRAPGW